MPATGYNEARRAIDLNGPCDHCGRPAEERHHIDRNPRNNARSNLQRLCISCHQIVHRRKNHCPAGHPLSGDNLYVRPNGRQYVCRECARRAHRAWYARNRAAQQERSQRTNAKYRLA